MGERGTSGELTQHPKYSPDNHQGERCANARMRTSIGFAACPCYQHGNRRRPVLGLFVAFCVSASMHAWLAAVALDSWAALTMGMFFVLQGVFVAAERRLSLHTWPVPVARARTILVVLGPSPLGIDPFLRVFGL